MTYEDFGYSDKSEHKTDRRVRAIDCNELSTSTVTERRLREELERKLQDQEKEREREKQDQDRERDRLLAELKQEREHSGREINYWKKKAEKPPDVAQLATREGQRNQD